MFIRQTIKKDNTNNKIYINYQLVESYRTEKGPRQRILLTIGSDVDLNKGERKLLANRIEEIICGIQNIVPYPANIELLAQHFAKVLLTKRNDNDSKSKPPPPPEKNEEKDYHSIDANSISTQSARTIGVEHVLYETFKELELDKLFSRLGFSVKQSQIAIATIIGRAAFPGSERKTHFHFQNTSALDELIGADFSKIPLTSLYLISDLLLENKPLIEKHLEKKERDLFNLKETIILYDLTNTYFEGLAKGNPKASHGHSKEKRSDCLLVTMGIVLDSDGFPKHSRIFEGNVSETDTFKNMISELSQQEQNIKPIVVVDAGIGSQGNINWLKENGFSYITVFRQKRKSAPENGNWVTVKDELNNTVKALLHKDPTTKEKHLYCHSSARERRELGMLEKKQEGFEAELIKLNNGLLKPRCMKDLDKVKEKIARLKEKYKRISRFYKIHIDFTGSIATRIHWTAQSSKMTQDFNGSYCLRTDCDFSVETLWDIYMMLNKVESAFREMKSELGMRPVHHQKEGRVDGHLWITLLAYHLTHTIRYKLQMNNINLSWSSIRDCLSSQIRVSTIMETKENKTLHVRTCTIAEDSQKEIYNSLKISSTPLAQHKLLV